jgi:hypothetical protein
MLKRAGAGQLHPPPSPPPQEFDVDPEAVDNEAWEEAVLAGAVAVFDTAMAEEARRRQEEEMASGGVQSGSACAWNGSSINVSGGRCWSSSDGRC